jgi:hypothetical protein
MDNLSLPNLWNGKWVTFQQQVELPEINHNCSSLVHQFFLGMENFGQDHSEEKSSSRNLMYTDLKIYLLFAIVVPLI